MSLTSIFLKWISERHNAWWHESTCACLVTLPTAYWGYKKPSFCMWLKSWDL